MPEFRRKSARKRVYFRLNAPDAKTVVVEGNFNDWETDARNLNHDPEGIWKTYFLMNPGTYEYRFLVDGKWRDDPEAPVMPNPFGTENCVRTVT